MTGILAIVVALALLMYLAYRGLSLLILAPALAALVALVSVDTPLLASYTQVFMGAASDFILRYFPLFLLGAVFGKLMEDSGSAEVLASAIVKRLGDARAILAVVLACAVMTYGGVSLFVVAFAVFPIAAAGMGIAPSFRWPPSPTAVTDKNAQRWRYGMGYEADTGSRLWDPRH
jgi:H+/gluconate symporter-like permease